MGFTPPEQRARPTNSPQSSASLYRRAGMIGCLALTLFAFGLFDDSFVDEYAYITQSYYADLFFQGQFHHPAWLDVYAFDLQPLPKYLIGASLRLADLRIPGPADAFRWYHHYTPFGNQATLTVARIPFLLLGALGCVALLGSGVLIKDRRVGTIAAVLLMINPLYRLHSHRAMSDVPYEAFLISALGLGLYALQRLWSGRSLSTTLLLVVVAGVAAGLSILCKFNGILGLMVTGSWVGLALIAPRLAVSRKLAMAGAALAMTAIAFAVFVALNPALTARPSGHLEGESLVLAKENPRQRFDDMVELRLRISKGQQKSFPHNALNAMTEKVKVFAVQGFGRFSPFGPAKSNSEIRYDVRQDWGAVFWWPMVLFGLVQSIRLGRDQLRSGVPPTAVALLIWAAVAWIVVAVYLPMAWDRYMLPIQAPNALLAAVGVSVLWDRLKEPIGAAWKRIYAPALWVFVILLGSYAFFWHTRDWNTASRLMLTYAMVDRGTVAITGLDQQTGDKAKFEGRFYSDKLPGYPLLAALPYAYARWAFDIPDHPLDSSALAYWPSDYWITLGTSGVLSAWTAALLVILARDLGCSPSAAALIGLSYGLSTPAYVYATLAYGHQASAFALLSSFLLLWRKDPRREALRIFLAGFLAAYAAVIELQVAPVSAILALYLMVQWVHGTRRFDRLGIFAVGALLPTLLLLAYNQVAFHSPWDMGYFHHATKEFAEVHNRNNPLGLMSPDWSKLGPLLWGWYRGLLVFAPILILAAPGYVVLMVRGRWSLAIGSMLVVAAIFLVNLSYPEWTGGWSTGPRLLVPLIPFAMIPVAGLMAGGSRWAKLATIATAGLATIGGVEMLLFQGAGARIPHQEMTSSGQVRDLKEPLAKVVWPIWTGQDPSPSWRFGRNLVTMSAPESIKRLSPRWRFVQFLPLVLVQCLAIVGLWRFCIGRASRPDSQTIPRRESDGLSDSCQDQCRSLTM